MTDIFEAQNDVLTFMLEVKGLILDWAPAVPVTTTRNLCLALIHEEAQEVEVALTEAPDALGELDVLVQVADGLADLIYVCLYTANAYGINMEPVWNEVQRTNMAKKGGPLREDGKLGKPVGWEPPNIKAILEAQINGS